MTEETIFATAIEKKTASERQAYLDEACAGKPELRSAVEELLRADSDAGSFLEHPPAGMDATVVATGGSSDTVNSGTWAVQLPFLRPCDKPGRIGKLAGTTGEYEIIEIVGHGGMGAVLRAFETKLSRVVAVKVMSPTLAANPTAVKRFLREATTAAAVHHDHVVTIHAVDEDHQPPYLVMQFIEGQTLQQKIDREGALELKHILRIGSQAAAGLAAAHKTGLIHRDVKPANILLENGVERVKITDFGLARTADDLQITQTGLIAGTPQYMSPEQARGEPIDARSDLFSLGSVLYTMCTGRPAFRADHPVAVLRRVCDDTPRPIRDVNADIPEWLEAIVNKLLAKDPADRFQAATEVAELLSQHLAHVQNPAISPLPSPINYAEHKKPAHAFPAINQALSAVNWKLAVGFWCWILILIVSFLRIVFSTDLRSLTAASAVVICVWGVFVAFFVFIAVAVLVNQLRTLAIERRIRDIRAKKIAAKPAKFSARGAFIEHPVLGLVAIVMLLTSVAAATYMITAALGRIHWSVVNYALNHAVIGLDANLARCKLIVSDGDQKIADLSGLEPWRQVRLPAGTYTIDIEPPDGYLIEEETLDWGKGKTQLTSYPRYNPPRPMDYRSRIKLDRGKRVVIGLMLVEEPGASAISHWPSDNEAQWLSVGQIPDGVTVVAKKDGRSSQELGSGGTIQLEPGTYRLTAQDDHHPPRKFAIRASVNNGASKPLQAVDDHWELELRKQDHVVIDVFDVAATNAAAAKQTEDWVQLFNGKDLTGWKTHPRQPRGWRVEKGVLIGQTTDATHLFTERNDFQDFQLHAEVQIDRTSNSGIYFRAPFDLKFLGDTYPPAYEVQIYNNDGPSSYDQYKTGSLHAIHLFRDVLVKNQDWFNLDIEARGSHVKVQVNGVTTVDTNLTPDPARKEPRGRFVLQAHKGTVRFRKIEVRDLSSAASVNVANSGSAAAAPPLAVAPFDATQANAHQEAWAKHLGVPVELTNSIGMKLRLIPPGRFKMGSTQEEADALLAELASRSPETINKGQLREIGTETPQREVEIPSPFYLGQYEVTIGQFQKFIDETGYQTTAEISGTGTGGVPRQEGREWTWKHPETARSNDHPVAQISLKDANAFCAWLTRKDGRNYVLPDEQHWEFACRSGTTGPWYGDQPEVLDSRAWWYFNAEGMTHPVGGKLPNAFGLFDMLGNVEELCLARDDEVVGRGGSQHQAAIGVRCAVRTRFAADNTYAHRGFRVAIIGDLKTESAPPAPAQVASAEPGWVQLFNGKDLRGWQTLPEQPGTWKVENGILMGQGGLSHLFSEKTYGDFHLRVEVNLIKGDGGIRFRTELGFSQVSKVTGLKYPAGYEGEIIDAKSDHAAGNTGSVRPMGLVREDLVPLGQWFTFEIIASGNHFITKVNGKVAADCYDPDRRFANGHVALSCGGSALPTIVRYRKVEIKELDAGGDPSR